MSLDIRLFPCLSDNYGFLARDGETGRVAAVDAPDGEAVIAAAQAAGWTIDLLLLTHWHPDHTQGAAAVKARHGCEVVGPAEVRRVTEIDREVGDGDIVDLGATRFAVIETGGHTLGHVSFHDAASRNAFVGDTLFTLGSGRLFEGTPHQMWASLQRLAALPDATTIWGAHEYTASNARFALAVDGSAAVKARATEVFALRERGEPTVPTTLAQEKAANPFLRAPLLHPELGAVEAYAAVRAAKDAFKG